MLQNPRPLTEADIQAQICLTLSWQATQHNFLFFAVPNEHDLSRAGNRYAAVNALKKKGLLPGTPDLVVVKDGRVYFLEVKRPRTGKVSDNQKIFMQRAAECGARCAVVHSVEETYNALVGWDVIQRRAKL